jgi:hypothetical protein
MTDTDLLSSEFPLWDDINNQYANGLSLDSNGLSLEYFQDDLNNKMNSDSPPDAVNPLTGSLTEESGRFLSEAPDPSLSLSQIYLEHALNNHQLLSLESHSIGLYPHPPLPSPEIMLPPAPPPSLTLPALYIQPAGTPPVNYSTPTEVYVPGNSELMYGTPKYSERSESNYGFAERSENNYGTPKHSVPIVTLNANNFSGNPGNLRSYLPESNTSRKRPNNPLPETELDSLNAKRLKNREAARRWRQGKKDQISDLQGEVYTLKNKLDAMQTEMETLRIENQYLKQELSKSRSQQPPQPPKLTQPPSPHFSLSSHSFRLAPSNPPPSSSDINFLPTPSLFLLCLFVFSLCLSIPPSTQGAFPGITDHSWMSIPGSVRQPRLFDMHVGSKLLLGEEEGGQRVNHNHWIFSMFNQVIQRMVGRARNLDEGRLHGELKVPLGEMNKHISSSLRLDKFL